MNAARAHTARCERRQLAAGGVALLEVCSCGSVHVTLGAITLRLHVDALPALATVIDEAAGELTLRQRIAEREALVS
jgi:hypothetical protein